MQRKFLTNLSLLIFLNLLVKPFWIFGIDRTVQNLVGSVDYGMYFVIFNFTFLFNILLDLGVTNFNNRNIAQNNHLLNKHFSSILILKLLLGFMYLVVLFVVALVLGYHADQLHFLIFLGINQFLTSFILYLRSNISGLLFFRTDSFLSVLDRLLMILFCSILLWGHVTSQPFRIEWFVYVQTLAYGITALVALGIVFRKARFRRLNWNTPFLILIIRRSFPFAVLVLLMSFYNRVDSVMLERILPGVSGECQAGVYAHAYRMLDAVNMIAYLFSVLLLPLFSKMIKMKEPVSHMVKLSGSLLLTVSVMVAVLCFVYNREMMDMLYNEHVDESSRVFRVLMIGFIPISLTYVFGTLLTANGNLKELNLMAGGAMALNLLMNFILIPRYLALGSAWASLTTQWMTALIQIFLVFRIFRFRLDVRFSAKTFIYILSVVVLTSLSKYLGIPWLWGLAISGFLSLVCASVLGLIHVGSLIAILKKE